MANTTTETTAPINWVTTTVIALTTLVAVSAVPVYGYMVGYTTQAWIVFGVLMVFTGMSITGGYHRLWSHKTYKAHWSLRAFFALWGAAAMEMSILDWSSSHRRHHQFVDDNDKDPYSINRGFWFAHMGWLLRDYESKNLDHSNVKDLQRDKVAVLQHKYYVPLIIFMNVPVLIAIGWMVGDIAGVFLLAGVLRIVLTHHFTWFINSAAHMWGRRPYTDENTARDNDFLALFTWGEGYHNYHHIFQWDYRNGVQWWQYDPTKWLIRACSFVGLTYDLKRVPKDKIETSMLAMEYKRLSQKLEKRGAQDDEKQMLATQHDSLAEAITEWGAFQKEWVHVKGKEIVANWENSQLHQRYLELKNTVQEQREQWQIVKSKVV